MLKLFAFCVVTATTTFGITDGDEDDMSEHPAILESRSLLEQGEYEKAAQRLRGYFLGEVAQYPEDESIGFFACYDVLELADLNTCISFCDELISLSKQKNFESQIQGIEGIKIRAYAKHGQFDKAYSMLNELSSLKSKNIYLCGAVSIFASDLVTKGEYEEALAIYEAFYKDLGSVDDNMVVITAADMIADMSIAQGKPDRAFSIYDQLRESNEEAYKEIELSIILKKIAIYESKGMRELAAQELMHACMLLEKAAPTDSHVHDRYMTLIETYVDAGLLEPRFATMFGLKTGESGKDSRKN